MKEFVPVYQYSEQESLRWNEQAKWRESFKENCSCARFIEEQIRNSFDGMTLDSTAAQRAVEEFGFDRVFHVLANTMQEKSTDGRFSQNNRAWGRTVCVPREGGNWAFSIESHPAVLDGFINQTRKLWQDQGFFEARHCLPDRSPGYDYENQVVVVSPTFFSQKYRKPEYQLMLAEHGFGCSPTASGRKVYGKILQDGEKIVLNRQDIIGVIRQECMPDWAKHRLEELTAPKQEQTIPGNPANGAVDEGTGTADENRPGAAYGESQCDLPYHDPIRKCLASPDGYKGAAGWNPVNH